VAAELFCADNTVVSASLAAQRNGQLMAALPCTFIVHGICTGQVHLRGAATAYELLGPELLLKQLVSEGFRLSCGKKGVGSLC
jgi:hypothetical protein